MSAQFWLGAAFGSCITGLVALVSILIAGRFINFDDAGNWRRR